VLSGETVLYEGIPLLLAPATPAAEPDPTRPPSNEEDQQAMT
jgi:hypothetical protein